MLMSGATTETSQRCFSSVVDPISDPHINGEYFLHNPTWHVEYSPSKARNIDRLLRRWNLRPRTICDVGCGAGEALRQLQLKMDVGCEFHGYDVAPQAIRLAKERENERLRFHLADFGELDTQPFDLLLALEVVDHVENYFGFLRMLKHRAEWKIFSFSLDICGHNAMRKGALLRRREVHCHMHHFSRETTLHALRSTGYEIVEACYTASPAFSTLARIAKPVRALAFRLNPDLTVRFFGGYSLLVLAR